MSFRSRTKFPVCRRRRNYYTDSSAKPMIVSHATMTSAVAAPAVTLTFSFNVYLRIVFVKRAKGVQAPAGGYSLNRKKGTGLPLRAGNGSASGGRGTEAVSAGLATRPRANRWPCFRGDGKSRLASRGELALPHAGQRGAHHAHATDRNAFTVARPSLRRSLHGERHDVMRDQARPVWPAFLRRYARTPTPQNPSSIIAQVEASGTAACGVASG